MTKEAFVNAIVIQAAIAGSSNAVLHPPAIAHELGISSTSIVDDIHTRVPVLFLSRLRAMAYPISLVCRWCPCAYARLRLSAFGCINITGRTLGEPQGS